MDKADRTNNRQIDRQTDRQTDRSLIHVYYVVLSVFAVVLGPSTRTHFVNWSAIDIPPTKCVGSSEHTGLYESERSLDQGLLLCAASGHTQQVWHTSCGNSFPVTAGQALFTQVRLVTANQHPANTYLCSAQMPNPSKQASSEHFNEQACYKWVVLCMQISQDRIWSMSYNIRH